MVNTSGKLSVQIWPHAAGRSGQTIQTNAPASNVQASWEQIRSMRAEAKPPRRPTHTRGFRGGKHGHQEGIHALGNDVGTNSSGQPVKVERAAQSPERGSFGTSSQKGAPRARIRTSASTAATPMLRLFLCEDAGHRDPEPVDGTGSGPSRLETHTHTHSRMMRCRSYIYVPHVCTNIRPILPVRSLAIPDGPTIEA